MICVKFLPWRERSSRFELQPFVRASSSATIMSLMETCQYTKTVENIFHYIMFPPMPYFLSSLYGPQTTHNSPPCSVGGPTIVISPLLSLHLGPLSKYQDWSVSADAVPHVSLETEHFITNYINLSAVFLCTDLKHLH